MLEKLLSPQAKKDLGIITGVVGGFLVALSSSLVPIIHKNGVDEINYFESNHLILGALVPFACFFDVGGFLGITIGIYILISPFTGLVLIKDFDAKIAGYNLVLSTMLIGSKLTTGSYFNIIAGIGSILALVLIAMLLFTWTLQMASDETKKQLGIETDAEKKEKLRLQREMLEELKRRKR